VPPQQQPSSWSGISNGFGEEMNCMPSPPTPNRRRTSKENAEVIDVSEAADKKKAQIAADLAEAMQAARSRTFSGSSAGGHFDLSPLNQILS
jgi:hypothetical protein